MSATDVREKVCTEAAMKAVVVYDDFELVGNATELLDLLSPSPEQTLNWDVKSYPFDELKHAAAARAAWLEAVEADLLVVAMKNSESVPSWTANWLETWAICRRVKDPAFVVLSGGGGADHEAAGVRRLRGFARRHNLSCICEYEPSANEDEPSCGTGDMGRI